MSLSTLRSRSPARATSSNEEKDKYKTVLLTLSGLGERFQAYEGNPRFLVERFVKNAISSLDGNVLKKQFDFSGQDALNNPEITTMWKASMMIVVECSPAAKREADKHDKPATPDHAHVVLFVDTQKGLNRTTWLKVNNAIGSESGKGSQVSYYSNEEVVTRDGQTCLFFKKKRLFRLKNQGRFCCKRWYTNQFFGKRDRFIHPYLPRSI